MNRVWLFLILSALCVGGCTSWKSESGVENAWRAEDAPQWTVGATTTAEVAKALGPPSQIIGLEKQTVYYYLREQKNGKGLFLLLWNWGENNSVYDRAVFFFNQEGLLTVYSYSREALPYDSN